MTAIDTLINTALVTALNANMALNALCCGDVFDTQARDIDGLDNWIVFMQVAGGDTNTSPRRDVNVIYRVEFISTEIADARTGAGYIDDALHQVELTVPGWSVYRCECTGQINLVDLVQGKQYWRKGRFVRISMDQNS